jgi:hypothetical protein
MNGAGEPSVLLLRNSTHKNMKTQMNKKMSISLGDLITAVSDYAQNERETVAAIRDLFRKGNVVAKTRYGSKRLKLA